jgi:hypothetical protein
VDCGLWIADCGIFIKFICNQLIINKFQNSQPEISNFRFDFSELGFLGFIGFRRIDYEGLSLKILHNQSFIIPKILKILIQKSKAETAALKSTFRNPHSAIRNPQSEIV